MARKGRYYGAGEIPANDKVFLEISKEAYKPKEQRTNVMSYVYDPAISTERTAVYYSPSLNKVIIGHRGTIPTDKMDLEADAFIIAGQFEKSNRFKRALKTVEDVQMRYPGFTISQTGHSLGGKTALAIGPLLGLNNSEVVAFNPGSSPIDIAKQLKDKALCAIVNSDKCKKLKKQRVYTTGLDPISISHLIHPGQTKIIKPEIANVHGLANFI
jgi:hypothetical protein